MLCYPLTECTTGADIFHKIDSYFTEKRVKWSKFCGLSIDDGKSILSCYSSLLANVNVVSNLIKWTHCSINRQTLTSKLLLNYLKDVLDDFYKMINFISLATRAQKYFQYCVKTLLLHIGFDGYYGVKP